MTLPYLEVLARDGLVGFLQHGPHVAEGLNVHAAKVYHEGVASAFDLPVASVEELLGATA